MQFPMMDFYPTKQQFDSLFPIKKGYDHKLVLIKYKHQANQFWLSGIQLVFDDGVKSPLIESSNASGDELYKLMINPSKTVRYIAMLM